MATISSNDVYNKYLTDDPASHIAAQRSNETYYRTAAIATVFFAGVVILGGTAALIHFAPVILPIYLVLASKAYSQYHKGIFLPMKEKGGNAGRDAEIYQKMSAKIAELGERPNYVQLFKNYGIIPHRTTAIDPNNPGDYSPYKSLLGRVKYWGDVEADALREIAKVDAALSGLTKAPEYRETKTELLMEKQRLEEVVLLPAKVAAAYALHVIADVSDTREYFEFGECYPASYISRLEGDTYYFYFSPEARRQPLSLQNMKAASPLELSKTIFGRKKAFVG